MCLVERSPPLVTCTPVERLEIMSRRLLMRCATSSLSERVMVFCNSISLVLSLSRLMLTTLVPKSHTGTTLMTSSTASIR